MSVRFEIEVFLRISRLGPEDLDRILGIDAVGRLQQVVDHHLVQNLRLMIDGLSRRFDGIDSPDPMRDFKAMAGKASKFFEPDGGDIVPCQEQRGQLHREQGRDVRNAVHGRDDVGGDDVRI